MKSNTPDLSILTYDKFGHGIDWLSYSIVDFDSFNSDLLFNTRIEKLDYDNASNDMTNIVDEVFTVQKIKTPHGTGYIYSNTYNTTSVPCFVVVSYDKRMRKFTGNSGIIHFYGSYFRLIDLGWFSKEFLIAIDSLTYELPFSRIDYRFDFFAIELHPVPKPIELFPNMRSNKKGRTWEHPKTQKLQSWALGNKDNKTIYIRYYNKNDELSGSLRKLFLYGDITEYKTFHRLEYECGYRFCCGLKGKDIGLLKEKIYAMSGIVPSKFKGNYYEPRIQLDLTDQIQKDRYVKIFISMAKSLKNSGVDLKSLFENNGL